MGDSNTNLDFQFVHSTLSTPGGPKDSASRTLIRKQAMKRVAAARRREGNYGKHNLRQLPVFVQAENPATGAGTGAWRGHAKLKGKAQNTINDQSIRTQKKPGEQQSIEAKNTIPNNSMDYNSQQYLALVQPRSIPICLPAKGYELTSMQSDFNILDLSTLATLHIGRAVRGALSQDPHHLIHQLRAYKRWSYLSFLPSRYGHVTCLSDATNCVIARARQLISPGNNWEAAVIVFYCRALNSLQKALDSPTQRYLPEVLCATEILAMYELLDPAGEKAWIRHTAGAAKLIYVRGPKSYQTEFEKALLIGHTVPIMTECLLNAERCYLEQPAWQRALQSVIDPTELISDRSEIVVTLLMVKSKVASFFVDATTIIYSTAKPNPIEITTLANRLRVVRKKFKDWHERYQGVLKQLTDMKPGSRNYDSHCKAFANFLSCAIITSRCLAALEGRERVKLEGEVQELVEKMFDLEKEVRVFSQSTSLFMALTLAISRVTRATTEDWISGEGREGGLIEKEKWERWCKGFGRKMP